MTRQPFFYDITLRDGNQSLKKPWNLKEKEFIFNKLVDFGVQAVETGFPAASDMDFDAVRKLAEISPENLVISALARTVERDIIKGIEAISFCKKPRLHTFIAMSPFNMKYVLNKSPQEVKKIAIESVAFSKEEILKVNKNGEIQFSVEHFGDCTENLPFVIDTLKEVVNAGATVINLPNTVERTRIKTFVDMVEQVYNALPEDIIIAVHCHNDLGMATAATVESYFAGATQLECCLNGLGERAGNTSLEEVVMALRCHKHLNIDTGINSKLITATSRMVSSMMNMPVQPNKAIVGRNAFAHSSGIHQDGVLKNRESYEIIDPVDVGLDESVIALTARSGRAALNHRLELLGYKLEHEELDKVYKKFLELADQKKDIRDDDLLYLVGATTGEKISKRIKLKYLQILTGTLIPTATVILKIGENERTATSTGNGPVDAAVKAIKSLINESVMITEFLIQAMNKGSDDVGRVHVQLKCGSIHGFSANTDVVKAAVEAFVDALNLINATEKKETK